MDAILAGSIQPGDVVVIRYEGPKGGPGHAGDARRHRRHEGRGAGRRLPRWSPTGGSRAARTASASATSRRRRSTADRSRSCTTATASSSTCTASARPDGRRGRAGAPPRRSGRLPSRATRRACWPSTPSSPRAPTGASPSTCPSLGCDHRGHRDTGRCPTQLVTVARDRPPADASARWSVGADPTGRCHVALRMSGASIQVPASSSPVEPGMHAVRVATWTEFGHNGRPMASTRLILVVT